MFRLFFLSTLVSFTLLQGCSQPELAWTLSAFNTYASNTPEFPSPDNSDWLNPDYTTFYRSRKPGKLSAWFWGTLNSLGYPLVQTPAEGFFELLGNTIEKRNAKNLKKAHVLVIKPKVKSRFFVWGDLQGALHSLLRDLNELKTRGVIDENLKIIHPDSYFVFNGNQIDRSPYNLEALSLIMVLMNQNPDRVIYVAGRHEINDTWRDYSTWRELWVAFCDELNLDCKADGNGIPQGSELLSAFFKTLPVSLYVLDSNKQDPRVLKFYAHEHSIEGDGFDNLISQQNNYSENPTTVFWKDDYNIKDGLIKIDAVVRASSRSISYRATDGLEMLEPEKSAISWSSLSSPVLANRELFDFQNDAFVQVEINSQINSSTISLFTQNAISKKGFAKKTFHLMSGKELTPKELESPASIPDYDVAFGSTFGLSGVASMLGQRIMSGVDLRIRKKNRNDEITSDIDNDFDNKILRFYITDDRSRIDLAQQNVELLMQKYNVHSLVIPAGIGTIEAMRPLIRDGSLSVFFPNSGATALRKPDLKHLINLRTSFTNETCALIRYAKEVLKKSKFAIAYQNDDFGKETFAAAQNLLKDKYNASSDDICAVPYESDTLDLDEPAAKLKACNANALLLLATYSAADAITKKIGLEALSEMSILGVSHITDALADSSDSSGVMEKRSGLTVVISRVVPNPDDTSLLVVRRYKDQMDREYKGASHNPDSLEAYIGTSLLIRTMEGMQRPTREKLMSNFENLKHTEHQGIHLNFNPKTRELLDELWLDTGKPKWINLKSANTLCDKTRDTNLSWGK